MRSIHSRQALLVVALMLGQWLSFAHSFQHPSTAAVDPACVLCMHAPGLDTGALAPDLNLPTLPILHQAPDVLIVTFVSGTAATSHPIRGPPTLS